jgi:ankyrin repeat protein
MSEAAVVGDAELIALLLDAGADVESPNPEGQTALMAVARTGEVAAARALIDAGADVNAREAWGGQTALMWAAAQRQPEMIALLIDAGAEVNARATVRDWERRVTSEPRIKEMLTGGLTALLYAAREGCGECARVLVENGADVDLADPDGVTPLVLALLNMRYDTAAYLIEAGADVDQWDWWGRTPLFAAIDVNTIPTGARADLPPRLDQTTAFEIAQMLLERGANPNLRLKLSPPLRDIVFDRGGASQLLATGATPLLRAAIAGDAPAIELLLAHGARVDLANIFGITPTMAAAGLGRSNNPSRGRFMTEDEAIASLELLIAAGGDINTRDRRGRCAMHGAARLGWNKVVRYLGEHGADLSFEDENGWTPYDYAAGRFGVVTNGTFDPGLERPDTMAILEEFMPPEAVERL